jgi:hypothetical protein
MPNHDAQFLITTESGRQCSHENGAFQRIRLMELGGLEPPTSWVRSMAWVECHLPRASRDSRSSPAAGDAKRKRAGWLVTRKLGVPAAATVLRPRAENRRASFSRPARPTSLCTCHPTPPGRAARGLTSAAHRRGRSPAASRPSAVNSAAPPRPETVTAWASTCRSNSRTWRASSPPRLSEILRPEPVVRKTGQCPRAQDPELSAPPRTTARAEANS